MIILSIDLESYPMPEKELKMWFLDQQINDYGVQVDRELVQRVIQCDEGYQEKLHAEATHLTGLENPNSPAQLKDWLADNHQLQVESLSKEGVVELLDEVEDSAIEARVIAWLAGEGWVLDTFKSHGRIYEMTASRMFRVPLELIVKGNPEYELRQKGKVAALACGYQGSIGALTAMGALRMGLKEEELPEIVSAWRQANPNIVKLWWDTEDAAIKAVKDKTVVKMQHGITFYCKGGVPIQRAIGYSCYVYSKGAIPLAPHVIFTAFLDDNIPEEREAGMQMGLELLEKCDELWAFGERISEGMAKEIALARELGIKVKQFNSRLEVVGSHEAQV